MSDVVEHEERITGVVRQFAHVVLTELDEGPDTVVWPLTALIHGSLREVVLRVYRRFNGSHVLCVDCRVGEFDDSPDLRRWVTSRTGVMPFVQARLDTTSSGKVTVVATHSLLADDVSASSLEQVLGSIDHVVPLWESEIGALSRPAASASRGESRAAIERRAREQRIVEAVAELEALTGLEPVKDVVRRLVANRKVAALRRAQGLRVVESSPHLVFTGNPGTGKTTVARLIGRIYAALGLLEKGHVVEADRSRLVGGYIGQTAIKTREVLEEASGGVLFIDEAYSLHSDARIDYGHESIETILAHMENNRGDIVLVVAGYPPEMERLLQSNPGLASRFDITVNFPDYSDADLEKILLDLFASHDYQVGTATREALRGVVASWERSRGFGNAREVRRLFHEVVNTHSESVIEGDWSALDVIDVSHVPAQRSRADAGSADTRGVPGYL